jgi:hypothetical protein
MGLFPEKSMGVESGNMESHGKQPPALHSTHYKLLAQSSSNKVEVTK